RQRLKNRRGCESFDLEVAGQHFTVTVGRHADGTIGEIFLQSRKPGSQSDSNARDAGIAASLALPIRLPAGNSEARPPAPQPGVAFDPARCRGRPPRHGGRAMSQLDRLRRLLGRTPSAPPVSADNPASGTLPEHRRGNDASQLKLLLGDVRDIFKEAVELPSAHLVTPPVAIPGPPSPNIAR